MVIAIRQALAVTEEKQADIQMIIIAAARKHGVDPAMALAYVEVESSFNPAAINPSDPSYGLGQIQAFWVEYFHLGSGADAPRLLMDPWFNADVLARIIHYFFHAGRGFNFGDHADIYNVGETLWRKGVRNEIYRSKILSAYERWKGKLQS